MILLVLLSLTSPQLIEVDRVEINTTVSESSCIVGLAYQPEAVITLPTGKSQTFKPHITADDIGSDTTMMA